MCEYDCNTSYDETVVTVEEVTNAIKKLDINKACGSDGICSEQIKYADKALFSLSIGWGVPDFPGVLRHSS